MTKRNVISGALFRDCSGTVGRERTQSRVADRAAGERLESVELGNTMVSFVLDGMNKDGL